MELAYKNVKEEVQFIEEAEEEEIFDHKCKREAH